MKPRHMLMTGFLVVAAYLALWGEKASPSANAATISAGPNKTASPSTRTAKREAEPIVALLPRASLMHDDEDDATNLFPAKSPLKGTPAVTPPPIVVAPPVAPAAPPLPFQFIGKQFDGHTWEVYLESTDKTLIVHHGDTLLGTYRVDDIKPPLLALTYLPLETKQTLAIGQGEE